MIIAHNLAAMNGQRQYKIVTEKKKKAMESLASGYRINRSADDAAGLSISEKMRGQIRGLEQANRNIQDGISLVKVADGALAEVNEMLHRMTELCVQAANDTNTFEDRQKIQDEIDELALQITQIGQTTEYNTLKLFDENGGKDYTGSVTNLVSSPSADAGYLSETVSYGGLNYPAATLDFSNIKAKNVTLLNNQSFSFNCSQACPEAFKFTFKTDGTPSSASDLSGTVQHKYVIDISSCKTGSEVVDTLLNYVTANPPTGNYTPVIPGSLGVSHSNFLMKNGSGNGLVLYGNTAGRTYPRPGNPTSGKIDCSEITSIIDVNDDENEFVIQAGANKGNDQIITIRSNYMNAHILGVGSLSVLSHEDASNSITATHEASETVAGWRARFGAYQNRLEYAGNNALNSAENLQNSESRIRDAEMADEVVENSMLDILQQAGMAMITQANQSTQGILNLIQ